MYYYVVVFICNCGVISYCQTILDCLVQVITLSDLECDFMNATQCCSKLNTVRHVVVCDSCFIHPHPHSLNVVVL